MKLCPTALALALLASVLAAAASPPDPTQDFNATTETVGPTSRDFFHNRFVTPVNQILTPAGWQVELPGLRPLALALSPDHSLLVVAGQTPQLFVVGCQTGKILQRVPMPPSQSQSPPPAAPASPALPAVDEKPQQSLTGLAFSPDGSRIYLSNVKGDLKVFAVAKDRVVSPLFAIPLPPVNALGRRRKSPPASPFHRTAKKSMSP